MTVSKNPTDSSRRLDSELDSELDPQIGARAQRAARPR